MAVNNIVGNNANNSFTKKNKIIAWQLNFKDVMSPYEIYVGQKFSQQKLDQRFL